MTENPFGQQCNVSGSLSGWSPGVPHLTSGDGYRFTWSNLRRGGWGQLARLLMTGPVVELTLKYSLGPRLRGVKDWVSGTLFSTKNNFEDTKPN